MRIAIVTGASSGIGREFARQILRLYRNLDELWVVARRTDRLKELERELGLPLRIFDGDLNRDYICEKMEKECLRQSPDIRMLVNAAGYGKVGPVDKECEEQLGQIDLNCRSLTRMIQLCLPYMRRGSRILNVVCVQPVPCPWRGAERAGDPGHCAVSRTSGHRVFQPVRSASRKAAGSRKGHCLSGGKTGAS